MSFSFSTRSPRKISSPEMAAPPKPPSRLAFQRICGPSLGKDLRRPVSDEVALASGPRNWGQSFAEREAAARVAMRNWRFII